MVVGTHKSNATKHPSKVLADTKQQRWTRKQIDEDKACTKALATAAKELANAKYQATITQVTDIMDSVEQDKEAIQAYTTRLDLCKPLYLAVAEKMTDLE